MDAQVIAPDDARLEWRGVISLQQEAGWFQPWRLPAGELSLHPAALVDRASRAAGVRLVLRSDADWLQGEVEPCSEPGRLDLCLGSGPGSGINNRIHASIDLQDADSFRFELPSGHKEITLWLPQDAPFRLRRLLLPAGSTLEQPAPPGPRWITYGSSITQAREAASPAQTWPASVARSLNLDLTCLGFSGECHLDPLVARVIRDRPADFVSLSAGINIEGGSSMTLRTFSSSLTGFLSIIRERHQHVPLLVFSPIWSPARETTPNAAGLDLELIRSEVKAVVERFQALGDGNMHHHDGLAVFGPELAEFLPDGLHPDAEGYRRLAGNFLAQAGHHFSS
jgi:lysophospholipase L1-like esterase